VHPIIVSIPHSSREIPNELKSITLLDEEDLKRRSDFCTDRIYAIPNTFVVQAKVARIFVDVNRAPDDVSRDYKLATDGATVLRTWDGKHIYSEDPSQGKLDVLVDRYHDPYHAEIDSYIPNAQFLFDCHSYTPDRAASKGEWDDKEKWPDFNIGNLHYSSCSREHTKFITGFFQKHGYTTGINQPFAGKYIIGHHCHRRRIPHFLVPGIQLELNEELFIDPETYEPLPGRIEEFRTLFTKLVDAYVDAFCQ